MRHKMSFVLAASLVLLLAAGCNKSVNKPVSSSGGSARGAIKLSGEPYASRAYLVEPNNLSAPARQALNGFGVSEQTLINGDTKIILQAESAGYTTQSYELKLGEKLYFIENNSGDDSLSDNTDRLLGDDTAVVVDQNGYVVRQ